MSGLPYALPWAALGDPSWTPPTPPPCLPVPRRTDVLVVGAGITGLACALHLTALGRDVTVIDRRFGRGVTSRSGGIILGDTLVGPAPDFAQCEWSFRAWIDAKLPGALVWTGCWELDRDAARPLTPIDWQDHGPVRVSGTVPGGLLDPAALQTQLAQIVAGRARMAVEGIELERLEGHGRAVHAVTTAGPILADHVLLCTDATLAPEHDDPWPTRLLTVVLETSPIPDALAAAIGWHDRRPFYTNDLPLLWGRPLPGDTMLVGRELVDLAELGPRDAGAASTAIARAGARLLRRLHHLHPALGLVTVRRVWAGPIARNAAGVPGIVPDAEIPTVWRVGGYGGHGIAQAFRLAAMAARQLATTSSRTSPRAS